MIRKEFPESNFNNFDVTWLVGADMLLLALDDTAVDTSCLISTISLKLCEASDLELREAMLVDPHEAPSHLSCELRGLKQMESCWDRVMGMKLVATDD